MTETIIIQCTLAEAKAAKTMLERSALPQNPSHYVRLALQFNSKLHKAIVEKEKCNVGE